MFEKIRSPGRHEAPGQFGLLATEVDSGEALAGDEGLIGPLRSDIGQRAVERAPFQRSSRYTHLREHTPTVVTH